MKVVVDTNIIFSALLNTNGTIGDLIFNSDEIFEFYSCHYMLFEIEKHWLRLLKISKLPDVELKEANLKILRKIQLINEELIPKKTWLAAEDLVKDIDIDDTDFIALTKHIKGIFWTGDKELYLGLKAKNYKKIYNTHELLQLRNSLSL